jgi:hypothetical protein
MAAEHQQPDEHPRASARAARPLAPAAHLRASAERPSAPAWAARPLAPAGRPSASAHAVHPLALQALSAAQPAEPGPRASAPSVALPAERAQPEAAAGWAGASGASGLRWVAVAVRPPRERAGASPRPQLHAEREAAQGAGPRGPLGSPPASSRGQDAEPESAEVPLPWGPQPAPHHAAARHASDALGVLLRRPRVSRSEYRAAAASPVARPRHEPPGLEDRQEPQRDRAEAPRARVPEHFPQPVVHLPPAARPTQPWRPRQRAAWQEHQAAPQPPAVRAEEPAWAGPPSPARQAGARVVRPEAPVAGGAQAGAPVAGGARPGAQGGQPGAGVPPPEARGSPGAQRKHPPDPHRQGSGIARVRAHRVPPSQAPLRVPARGPPSLGASPERALPPPPPSRRSGTARARAPRTFPPSQGRLLAPQHAAPAQPQRPGRWASHRAAAPRGRTGPPRDPA